MFLEAWRETCIYEKPYKLVKEDQSFEVNGKSELLLIDLSVKIDKNQKTSAFQYGQKYGRICASTFEE